MNIRSWLFNNNKHSENYQLFLTLTNSLQLQSAAQAREEQAEVRGYTALQKVQLDTILETVTGIVQTEDKVTSFRL